MFKWFKVLWRRGAVVITTAQLHSTKPELRFRTGSNPARGLLEIPDVANLLTMVPTGNKANCLSLANHTIKTCASLLMMKNSSFTQQSVNV